MVKKVLFILANIFVYAALITTIIIASTYEGVKEDIPTETEEPTEEIVPVETEIDGYWLVYNIDNDPGDYNKNFEYITGHYILFKDGVLTYYVNEAIELQCAFTVENSKITFGTVLKGELNLPESFKLNIYSENNIELENKDAAKLVRLIRVECETTYIKADDLYHYWDIALCRHNQDNRSVDFLSEGKVNVYQKGKKLTDLKYSYDSATHTLKIVGLGDFKVIKSNSEIIFLIEMTDHGNIWQLKMGSE